MGKKFCFHVKKIQKIIAIFVVLLVLFGTSTINGKAMAMEEDPAQTTATAEPSAAPEVTSSSDPAQSPAPSESAEPTQSKEPIQSVEPTQSAQPVESTQPAESASPAVNAQPSQTPQPTASALLKQKKMTILSVGTPDAQANNEAALNTALSNATGTASSPYVIEVTASFSITAAKTIASGKYIKLVSSDGSTFALTRNGSSYDMFDVQGSLILENIIIDGGGITTTKNSVKVSAGATFDMEAGAVLQNAVCTSSAGGSAVYNQGTFNLNGGAIKGNRVPSLSSGYVLTGGVIYNDGTFAMTAGSITGNQAITGSTGTLYVYGGVVYNSGSAAFTMSGGIIGGDAADANTATAYNDGPLDGGVVYNLGIFIMNHSALIKGNISKEISGSPPYGSMHGGAVYNSGTFTMSDNAEITSTNVNISNTSASGIGVYSTGSSAIFTMQDNAKISGNTGTTGVTNTAFNGGGVYNCGGSQFTMQGYAEISGNQISSYSSSYGAGVCNKDTGSTFTMKDNSKISNNTVSANYDCFGGGVYNTVGTFTMIGGTISGNSASSDAGQCYGGGVYNGSGLFSLQDGIISNNTTTAKAAGKYSRGGGVFVNNDTFNMSGGTISGNESKTAGSASTEGGGVFNWNNVNMSGGTISGNKSAKGSGLFNTWAFNMSGNAEISSNTASVEGGGIENTGSATFTLTGGTIAGNTAPKGNGVLNAATFNMSGAAAVDTNNDVYLNTGKVINVTAALSGTSPFAKITPPAYSAGSNVVALATGLSADAYAAKFLVAPNGTTPWGLKANGQNLQLAPGEIYLNGVAGTDTNDGSTKATAVATFEKAKSLLGSPGTIYICGTVTIPGGNDSAYTWSLPTGQTVKRYKDPVTSASDFTGVMVQLDGNLTLQNITIDGGWDEASGTGIEAVYPIILENSTGDLTINAGAALQNNNIVIPSPDPTDRFVGSGVQGTGNVTMAGGKICGNQINILSGTTNRAEGAGIGMDTGTLTLTGGVISGNALNAPIGFGAGIYVHNTVFGMSGGTVSGNDSCTDGGGVFIDSGTTFTMSGGTIGGSTAGDANTADMGGGLINFGTINMTGGSVMGNTASSGGGVLNQGDFNMSGTASIDGNTATTGAGVYHYGGTFDLSGGALIAQNNPVYLNTSTYITVTGALSNRPTAWIIPAAYPGSGGSVKVAEAGYTGATGTTILDALAAVNSGYGLQASGNDVNLVKKLDAAITLSDASADYTGSPINFSGTVTKPDDISLSDLTFLYKLKTADDSTYTPTAPTNAGVYSVKATFTGNAKYNGTVSNVAAFTISRVMPAAEKPVFTKNLPGGYTYYSHSFTCNLKVKASVSDNGVITYQWYKNTINSTTGGSRIAGATGESYKVPAATNGTVYYYVVATNTLNNDMIRTASAVSNIARVTVSVEEPEPEDSADPEDGADPEETISPEETQSPGPSASSTGDTGTVPEASKTPSQAPDNQDDIMVKVVPATPDTPAVTVPDMAGLKDSVLTPEERKALQNGESITIFLKVERVEEPVNQGDHEKVAANLGGNTLGMYLNVELLKQIGESQQQITKIDKPMRIVLAVPSELLKDGRAYSIIRVHGDETTMLPDLDNDPLTITIETDRFSTYALVYQDRSSLLLWLILMICILLVLLIIFIVCVVRKKRRKYSV
jgi:hypothetical protein